MNKKIFYTLCLYTGISISACRCASKIDAEARRDIMDSIRKRESNENIETVEKDIVKAQEKIAQKDREIKEKNLLQKEAATSAEKAKKAVEQAKLAIEKAHAQLGYLADACHKIYILLHKPVLAIDKVNNLKNKANDLFKSSNRETVEINSAIKQADDAWDESLALYLVLQKKIPAIKNMSRKIYNQLNLAKEAENEKKTAKVIAASKEAISQLKKLDKLVESQQCEAKLKLAEEQTKLAREKANFALAKAAGGVFPDK